MQGVSKNRFEHLKDALLKLEGLSYDDRKYCGCLQQAADYNRELETMYRNYERPLKELSRQIVAYEVLYIEVKEQFLGKS